MTVRIALLAATIGLVAFLTAGEQPPVTTCALTIELVDRATGETLPGVVKAFDEQGNPIPLEPLVNRGQGIEPVTPLHNWWVLPKVTTIEVPAAPLKFLALAGLETELATERVDLTGKAEAMLTIRLDRFHQARRSGYVAGNTHLHLMKLSKKQADRYLSEVPLADGLDIVFLSYLERAQADLEYTSNKYTHRELAQLSHGHVHFGHGEEHRHNFDSHGEGYGHILLLDIPVIIQPVSIGPGITGKGSDAPPLQRGIDEARRLGGKVVWAHNMYGFEDIPNWLTGRVHANNIFDGSERGSYQDTYYRYLNVGLRVPFSTGTDWFIYDFSRVYVMADRPLTPTEWLDGLAAGKTYITNGPLLEFTADGQPLGSTIELAAAGKVKAKGRAIGRADFGQLELIENGRVVRTTPCRAEGDHFVAELAADIPIKGPAWLALRTPPPPAKKQADPSEGTATNEYGGRLFSHTSPLYVRFAGADVFDRETAEGLVAEMKSDWAKIEDRAVFATDTEKKNVRSVYQEAISRLEARLGE